MYKLLIVDDEEIEREGMAHFIPWEEQGIQLVGTAWNGVQGLEMMECLRPDIVLVDVKMPVMNGLEMIRQARQTFPDVVYVILSGYGEYEFTSQAMEEGVRHYLLKPCDEKRIREVLDKVKAELSERQAQASKDRDARVLLPHAREQIFCDLVLDRAQVGSTATCHFMERLGGESRPVLLATVRLTRGFDYLERFVIGNIMTDLLPTGTLLCTGGQEQDTFLLLDPAAGAGLEQAFARLQVEFRRFEKAPLQAAVSVPGALGGLPELYRQTAALLALGGGEETGLLRYGGAAAGNGPLFDYRAIQNAPDYEQLLLELYTGLAKMQLRGYGSDRQQALWTLAWKLLAADAPLPELTLCGVARALAQRLALPHEPRNDRAALQMRQIYEAVYDHLADPALNLLKLARDCLFVSEDHLSRMFSRRTGTRLTHFIESRRVEVARRLIDCDPNVTNARLAELVGYPPDGRYFSRVFRKQFGMTPGEYREKIRNQPADRQ